MRYVTSAGSRAGCVPCSVLAAWRGEVAPPSGPEGCLEDSAKNEVKAYDIMTRWRPDVEGHKGGDGNRSLFGWRAVDPVWALEDGRSGPGRRLGRDARARHAT